jgi:hypothetical protein
LRSAFLGIGGAEAAPSNGIPQRKADATDMASNIKQLAGPASRPGPAPL